MSTPDAEDASPSPEYSGAEDVDMAAEQQSEPQSGETSPDQKPSNGQKSASNKDPTRPRRKKARRACFACQRAHLTCGDERPCHRCLKRNLQDSCMDGVRKKAKYLHDAPDGALMPGMGGHYPHMNGDRPVPMPPQEQAVPVGQPGGYFTQAPSTTYYAPNIGNGPVPPLENQGFVNPQPPLSPPYSQPNQQIMASAPPSATQGPQPQLQQFGGGPLFDPSDPALFNFDISSLNFGNHYGALELGMLGHMSLGAAESAAHDHRMSQATGLYTHQLTPGAYGEHSGVPAQMSFSADGISTAEWQNPHSRHNSLQMQTPTHTPHSVNLEHANHRPDSLNGPHAYAIGQGSSSLSSASPASTDVNSGYDNDNSMAASAMFANSNPSNQPNQSHAQHSPTTHRLHQDSRVSSGPLQPVQSNAIRRRRPEAKSIYARTTKSYDYVNAFHRFFSLLKRKYSAVSLKRALAALQQFRPVLLSNAGHLDDEDLIFMEKNLQRSLITMQTSFAEVGTPCLICRRTGEVVGMNKEFEILTGWRREILLGQSPNLNINKGPSTDRSDESNRSSQTNTTPVLTSQEHEKGPHPVNVLELMDESSSLQYLDDFADLAYEDPLGKGHRRANMLRYLTKEDMTSIAERSANGKPPKVEARVKHEDGSIHQGEAAMRNLGTNGLIDAMIMWHIKRDNFDMPMLVAMQIMPMLKP